MLWRTTEPGLDETADQKHLFAFAHGVLNIGEALAPAVVRQVKHHIDPEAINIIDASAGTGCPVIASVSGVDFVLIVTEPTVSGIHDMDRVLKLSTHFGVPTLVVINKADLNEKQAQKIKHIAKQAGSPVIGEIPFDSNVNEALMNGKTVIEHGIGPAVKAIHAVWNVLQKEVLLKS